MLERRQQREIGSVGLTRLLIIHALQLKNQIVITNNALDNKVRC